jgi:Kef-type K+ transport system membrane component KefB
MLASSIFNEFALLMSLSAVVGYVAVKLRQPLILSFILVGIIAGPSVLGWITAHNELEVLASFGVTLLLFIVGLKLDIALIQTYGMVAVVAGLGQIALTTLAGGLLGVALGIPLAQAFYVAFALTFSSTIIIIKILTDKMEIDSLYGRIAIGILIIQDLVVVIAIIALSSLSQRVGLEGNVEIHVISLLLKGAGFLAGIVLLSRYVFPVVLEHVASSRELLILFAIAWAALLAVGGDMMGFGKEIGGFLAGVSLASSHYREAIAARLEALRNLLLLFFFLNLGASLQFSGVGSSLLAIFVFSLFVLLAKPLIVIALMGALRFRKRTGFLAGVTMGQVSEFSLILAGLGITLGYIDSQLASLITFVGVITIAISTYVMNQDNYLYELLSPFLSVFEAKTVLQDEKLPLETHLIDVIVYGYGRHGEYIAKVLEKQGLIILGIDFDPYRVKEWQSRKRLVRYGDAEDIEFVKSLPLAAVKMMVSTLPMIEANRVLVSSLREAGYTGKIALSAHHEHDIGMLRKMKPDMLLIPYADAAQQAAERILAALS